MIAAEKTLAIEVQNVSVSYHLKPAIRNVTLQIHTGQLVGVIGPNGAGKSTLLKAVVGLLPLDNGRVLIFGEPVEKMRARVAYVPQKEAIDWDFPVTVEDVVMMGRFGHLGIFQRPTARDREIVAESLRTVEMTELGRRHIRQLSGGQQQRVFVARALAQQADILLLDEPFVGIDAATEQTLFDLMRALKSQGKTVVVVNHDLSIVDRYDMLVMLNQRLVAAGPTQEVFNPKTLHETYGGRLTLLQQTEQLLVQS
jgi:manganese/zinc/iron transport system ATP- binding protein